MMGAKHVARSALGAAMRIFAEKTFFSKHAGISGLAFEVLGQKQSFIVCSTPSGEAFVVHPRDGVIGKELFRSGTFDIDKLDVALGLLRRARPASRPTVLVDVGANIGTICIPAVARNCVERAIAIEPDPTNARLLRANVCLNGLDQRVSVVEAAAGPNDGQELELELSATNLGDHRVRVSMEDGIFAESSRTVVKVPSLSLDTICRDIHDDEAVLWMDTQGFEGFVLAGSRTLLARKVPVVLEFWPYGMKRAGSFDALTDSLGGYGGFFDLDKPQDFRPIGDLVRLYAELGEDQAFTDILVL